MRVSLFSSVSLSLIVLASLCSPVRAQNPGLRAQQTIAFPSISELGKSTLPMLDMLAGKAPRLATAGSPVERLAFTAAGVGNAGSYQSGAVAPGEIIVIFGTDLGPGQLTQLQVNGEKIVTELAGTRVLFDGVPSPIIYTFATQTSVVVPYAVWNRQNTSVQVERNGVLSEAVVIPVTDAVPGLFTLDGSGQGQAAIINQDGTTNSPENPAPQGSIVALYATGEGQTDPVGVDGQIAATSYPKPLLAVEGDIAYSECYQHYAGAAPWMVAGVIQVNITVPDINGGPNVPVHLRVGDKKSPDGVTMAVVQNSGGALAPRMTLNLNGTTYNENPDLGGSGDDTRHDVQILDGQGRPILGVRLQDSAVISSNTGKVMLMPAPWELDDYGTGAALVGMDVADFAGIIVDDANFRSDSWGEQGPVTATRSSDGNLISFVYDPPLVAPKSGFMVVIVTNSTEFDSSGSITLYARLPGDETLYSVTVNGTYAPK